jgi:hypothetical protein
MKEFLKKNKVKVGWTLAILAVVLDIPAYFLMPDVMVVQVGLTGEATSMVEKDVYLFLVTLLQAFFAYLNFKTKDDPKLSWALVAILFFLVNFFIMGINLMS